MSSDSAALRAACDDGTGLCTIVRIDGSFSRRLGAQLAVRPDGSVVGSLADGCLEKQLAREVLDGGERRVQRFGAGSELIDFRLPCGSGLDILIDPAPDRADCRAAVESLDAREPAALALPQGPLEKRLYIPDLRLEVFGEGPELDALAAVGGALGLGVETHDKSAPGMALGRAPDLPPPDRWTAVVLLFHDHEWELPILEWALASDSFFIGAQGGRPSREERLNRLAAAGHSDTACARIVSPLGLAGSSREPAPLAVAALAQIMALYEALHPHHG